MRVHLRRLAFALALLNTAALAEESGSIESDIFPSGPEFPPPEPPTPLEEARDKYEYLLMIQQLNDAVQSANLEEINKLLEQGADPLPLKLGYVSSDFIFDEGIYLDAPPFLLACEAGNWDIVQALWQKIPEEMRGPAAIKASGVSLEINDDGSHRQIQQFLLEQSLEVFSSYSFSDQVLKLALQSASLEVVQAFWSKLPEELKKETLEGKKNEAPTIPHDHRVLSLFELVLNSMHDRGDIIQFFINEGAAAFNPDISVTCAIAFAANQATFTNFETLWQAVTQKQGAAPLRSDLIGLAVLNKNDPFGEIIQFLLNNGADPLGVDHENYNCFHRISYAARSEEYTPKGKFELVWNSLSKEQRATALEIPITQNGNTALYIAARVRGDSPNLDYIQFLLRLGANPMKNNLHKLNSINACTESSKLEAIKLLWNHISPEDQAKMLAGTSSYTCPLISAAQNSDIEVTRFFLDLGSNLLARDAYNNTALHLACYSGNLPVVAKLWSSLSPQDRAQATEMLGEYNNTLLLQAVYNDSDRNALEIIDFLLAIGANIYARNVNGNSLLHLAGAYGTESICRRAWKAIPLQEQEAALNLLNLDQQMPEEYSLQKNRNPEGVKRFFEECRQTYPRK